MKTWILAALLATAACGKDEGKAPATKPAPAPPVEEAGSIAVELGNGWVLDAPATWMLTAPHPDSFRFDDDDGVRKLALYSTTGTPATPEAFRDDLCLEQADATLETEGGVWLARCHGPGSESDGETVRFALLRPGAAGAMVCQHEAADEAGLSAALAACRTLRPR